MAKNTYIYLITILFLAPLMGSASETRVDSIGGLSLVIDDESVTPNPFLFGNPAGLSLLTPQNRFDASGLWFGQSVPFDSTKSTQYYGSLDHVADPNGSNKYHGLMFFPTNRWGVQLDGDDFYSQSQPSSTLPIDHNNRTRQFFRTSYNFGPFVLGGEIDPLQTTTVFKTPGSFNGNALDSGTGTTNALSATTGLLACFPGDASPKQSRLEIGGIFADQLSPAKEIDNLIATPLLPPNPVTITETITVTTAQSFGPQIYFDSPGSFQLVLVSLFTNSAVSAQLDSSNPSAITAVPSFQAQTSSQTEEFGGFKMSNPLAGGLNLKSGLFFLFQSQNSNSFNPDGTGSAQDSRQNWQLQTGLGVEKKDDFTVGLQGILTGVHDVSLGLNGNTAATGTTDYLNYKISAGGERWLSPHVAFRMGLTLLNEYDQGKDIQLQYYDIADGQRIITTTVTAGLGYKDPGFYSDLMLWYGQPELFNSPNPNFFVTQTGIQLAVGFFF